MLALIAGQGDLPARVAARCKQWPLVVAMDHAKPDELIPEISFRLETLGTLLQQLAEAGVHEVCFAGGMPRPDLDASKIDHATAPLVPRMLQALGQGDDGALRIVLDIFQAAGFSVKGIEDIVPDFLLSAGCATKAQPSAKAFKDVAKAQSLLNLISSQDIGQGCVVAQGQVLAIETIGGTDWMLNSLADRTERMPAGGVLFKAPKLGQVRSVDLPTIGPATIKAAVTAKLDGISIEAGGVLVLDPEDTIAVADNAGLFLMVVEAEI